MKSTMQIAYHKRSAYKIFVHQQTNIISLKQQKHFAQQRQHHHYCCAICGCWETSGSNVLSTQTPVKAWIALAWTPRIRKHNATSDILWSSCITKMQQDRTLYNAQLRPAQFPWWKSVYKDDIVTYVDFPLSYICQWESLIQVSHRNFQSRSNTIRIEFHCDWLPSAACTRSQLWPRNQIPIGLDSEWKWPVWLANKPPKHTHFSCKNSMIINCLAATAFKRAEMSANCKALFCTVIHHDRNCIETGVLRQFGLAMASECRLENLRANLEGHGLTHVHKMSLHWQCMTKTRCCNDSAATIQLSTFGIENFGSAVLHKMSTQAAQLQI